MAKIRVLFYRAIFGDKKWLDDAISLWTGLFNMGTGPYSHVELQTPEDGYFELRPPSTNYGLADMEYMGTCYTSTMRGKTKGVVKRPVSEVLKNPRRWDYCEIEVGEKRHKQMIETANLYAKEYHGYDFKAIVSFFWYKRIGSRTEFICSELVYHFLFLLGVFKLGFKCPSPRRLSRWLTKKGIEIKPLQE